MHRQTRIQAVRSAALIAVIALGNLSAANAADWQPATYSKEETLKLRTVCPGEGAYWFPVWLVVLDDQVYVRLGSKAASRIECNAGTPVLAVEVADQKFDAVEAVAAPEMVNAVNQAMAEKYTSDLLIRWFPHPLTLRLLPQP